MTVWSYLAGLVILVIPLPLEYFASGIKLAAGIVAIGLGSLIFFRVMAAINYLRSRLNRFQS
jgi:hypothetical protein